jgi:hypothetical protein
MEQKLRILCLPVVNRCMQGKATTQALHHKQKLVTQNNKQYIYIYIYLILPTQKTKAFQCIISS